jgi:hypothetical protein
VDGTETDWLRARAQQMIDRIDQGFWAAIRILEMHAARHSGRRRAGS